MFSIHLYSVNLSYLNLAHWVLELIKIKYKCTIGFLGGRSNHLHLGNLYYITLLLSVRYFDEHNQF